MKFDIVIAGGGFAGAYCAKTLGRIFGEEGLTRVALVAEYNVLMFQPMLAEVVGSALSPQDVVNPLRLFCPNITVLQGQIREIDPATRTLRIDGGRFTRDLLVGYEHLVLALGSVTDLSRVPGMSEYGFPMKTVSDALRLRSAAINRLEEANLNEDTQVQARLLTFVVVGGGYTGVETAGQILDLLAGVKSYYSNLAEVPHRVILVHSQESLLAEIGPELGNYAQRVLEKRGMEFILKARVIEVSANRAVLDGGTVLETNTVVTSVGNAPNPVVLTLCKSLGIESQKGRVPTNPEMQVEGQDRLWAVGDCAAVPWEGKVAPPTAQFAMRQGDQLGQNLVRALRGETLQPFAHQFQGQLASIGHHEAVAEVFGFRFSGFIAWWLWRSAYLSKLPGLARKIRVMIDWTLELFFSRDISLVQPPAEEPLREVHVLKGEIVFRKGRPVRAFGFVRSGALRWKQDDGTETVLGPKSMVDQTYVDAEGLWKGDLIAEESSDLLIFRGKALTLLKKDLKITAR